MIKKLIYLTLLLALTYCDSMPKDWNWGLKPRPLNGLSGFPSAKTDYGLGFKEGCAIGMSTVGAGLMSDFTAKKLNVEDISKSADYRNGWWDGFEQCVYIIDWDVI